MVKGLIVRIESLIVLALIGSPACSLLAPSDSELSGSWGVGGVPASDDGGQASGAGRASGGTEPTLIDGGADAGESGSDDGSGMSSAGSTDTGGGTGAVTGSGGKTGAGGVHVGGGGAIAGNGGTVATGGGTLGSAGSAGRGGTGGTGGTGGNVSGAGGAVSHCSPNPCARGTCSEAMNGYKCTCPAGWGGTTCAVGSCSTLSCPASAPCTVPASNVVAVCYPSACVGSVGLCMAANADGSGDAIIIEGRNPTFDALSGSSWVNRAKYFGYLDNAHGGYACVFPQPSEGGTPLVIPLNTVRTKTAGFGQSNSWPNPPTCSYP